MSDCYNVKITGTARRGEEGMFSYKSACMTSEKISMRVKKCLMERYYKQAIAKQACFVAKGEIKIMITLRIKMFFGDAWTQV